LIRHNPEVIEHRKATSDEIVVNFEYVQPSEAYYHTIRALVARYLDGEYAESLDLVGLTDHICERASIGQVVVSPL
jgi:hypothetical protein